MDATRNTTLISVPGIARRSIPDVLLGTGITEFKNAIEVNYTVQMRIQATYASLTGQPLNLVVSPVTQRVSAPLQQAIAATGGTALRSGNRNFFLLPMTPIFFEILSPLPLNRKADAQKLFAVWAEAAPNTLPDRIGSHEPLRQEFSINNLEDALPVWEYHVLLKRVAKPKLTSSVFMQHGPHRRHSTWSIAMSDRKHVDMQSIEHLISTSAVEFSADFGFIHEPSDLDTEIGLATGSIAFLDVKRSTKNLFLTTHILKKYLPDIYWITVFGKPYVELFSRERLLSAPVFRVRELSNGSILMKLFDDFNFCERDAYENRKQSVKKHLFENAFFDLSKGTSHEYTTSEFHWGEIMH